ncbi:zinc finger CCCH domain-containing protein 23-like [Nymphaea colorata]|nr:zinc finger CCCH domain-containing protein 23-like [Nymphaea colorata]
MTSVCCSPEQLKFLTGKKARPSSVSGFHEALDLSPTATTTTTAATTLRRLLLQRADSLHSDCSLSPSEAYALQRFLPSNYEDGGAGDEEEEDAVPDDYACDEFRMYEFKVRRCTRGRSHDWTDCPFAHPGEKARRRDPRRYNYSATPCPDFRKGACRRGDACEFAHGVFECWLHPSRYRTQPCKDGLNCRRKVCFFAHTPQQLRVPGGGGCDTRGGGRSPRCCAFCSASKLHQWVSQGGSSPNSTLMVGVSPFSPPASPPISSPPLSVSPASPYFSAYQSFISELASSLDSVDLNSTATFGGKATGATAVGGASQRSLSWSSLPSIDRTRPSYSCTPFSTLWRFQEEEEEEMEKETMIRDTTTTGNNNNNNQNDTSVAAAISDPDFGWVNELIM